MNALIVTLTAAAAVGAVGVLLKTKPDPHVGSMWGFVVLGVALLTLAAVVAVGAFLEVIP